MGPKDGPFTALRVLLSFYVPQAPLSAQVHSWCFLSFKVGFHTFPDVLSLLRIPFTSPVLCPETTLASQQLTVRVNCQLTQSRIIRNYLHQVSLWACIGELSWFRSQTWEVQVHSVGPSSLGLGLDYIVENGRWAWGCMRSFSALAGGYDSLHAPSALDFPVVMSCNLQLSAEITPLSCRQHFFFRVFCHRKWKRN